jgi:carbon-monoxide dehydrogenase large subunit
MTITKFGTAQSVDRVEDQRLITGQGRYVDDISVPGALTGYVLRSPHAHARIAGIDIAAALAVPGVHAVYTVADIRKAGLGDLDCQMVHKGGTATKRPLLAEGHVRFVGDPVAFVVADSLNAARDGAEAVMVEYEDLPAVTGIANAIAGGAPQLWDGAKNNLAFDWTTGNAEKTEALFAQAAHVTRLTVVNNRVVVASMENRSCIAMWDAESGRFTFHGGSQNVFMLRRVFAKNIFKMDEDRFHILTPDVGGGFGMKMMIYPEPILCLFAARMLNRPVRWSADRSEAFLSDTQGRDNLTTGEIAMDRDGRFLALRVLSYADMGAYLSTMAPFIPTAAGSGVLPSVYTFQAMSVRVHGVFTNSVPIDAYRGAGRPESNYLVERLIDVAAVETGIDRIELRRRNMVPESAMPWTSASGYVYDSGAFEQTMSMAIKLADWDGFAARKAASKARGKRRGIGLAHYLEATAPVASEWAEIRFTEDGMVEVLVGTQSTGQGHETAYIQILSERLGVPPERFRVVQGDSDRMPKGGGTGGARSLYAQGTAVITTSNEVIKKGKDLAAPILDARPDEVDFDEGLFRSRASNRTIGLLELAAQVRSASDKNNPLNVGMDAPVNCRTFPNGCHVCEVEIDEATGVPVVDRYVVVDDFGTLVNPKIARGQVHGGVVQGIGQALYEQVVWSENGQPLTGSFTDYCLPRADNLPDIVVEFNEGAPCKTNILGVKGAGEAGSVGSCPAVISAVVDALKDLGVTHVDMPALPETLWLLMQNSKARA